MFQFHTFSNIALVIFNRASSNEFNFIYTYNFLRQIYKGPRAGILLLTGLCKGRAVKVWLLLNLSRCMETLKCKKGDNVALLSLSDLDFMLWSDFKVDTTWTTLCKGLREPRSLPNGEWEARVCLIHQLLKMWKKVMKMISPAHYHYYLLSWLKHHLDYHPP